ncbi:hypothetical protein BCR33DRAFT_719614 [Rhizoclosmatium globosum]|uniref:G-protein coupled receptors family 1 profile domain-containing protein n=1 Tax=Rhizoclosmatium globosum TaxID=329046 RepID=A0A1Y2BZQ7_9FUNG|nr:hypothetical protein BCR33DRAFT_719614 [Rhizoclosmatium globosum]|eukprot:ORY40258.1 hypothetical protein BCR33DRAFT_719614 [Rhizoclosmatium globosum]
MSTFPGLSPFASNLVTFWANANSYSALVTFSTFMVMQHNGHASISYDNPNHMIRAMVWLDTIAFGISFTGSSFITTATQPCQRQIFSVLSQIFWSVKDGFKYVYLTHRCWVICGFQDRIIGPALFGGVSTLLSWLFFAFRYSFTTVGCVPVYPESTYTALNLAMYAWFSISDIIPSALLIRHLRRASQESTAIALRFSGVGSQEMWMRY